MGDYWGKKFSGDSKGISAVFCLTEKGKQIINDMIKDGKVIELEKTSIEDMLKYQNMAGYEQNKLHDETLEMIKCSDDVTKAVEYYLSKMSYKQKLKSTLLRASGIIPGSIRYKIKRLVRI